MVTPFGVASRKVRRVDRMDASSALENNLKTQNNPAVSFVQRLSP
jgi:hypothetical protein